MAKQQHHPLLKCLDMYEGYCIISGMEDIATRQKNIIREWKIVKRIVLIGNHVRGVWSFSHACIWLLVHKIRHMCNMLLGVLKLIEGIKSQNVT